MTRPKDQTRLKIERMEAEREERRRAMLEVSKLILLWVKIVVIT